MPKTKEEILADITKAVEGQGNQGAIAIAPILKDIVELAGEGGGGGGTTYTVFDVTINEDHTVATSQEDLKAIYDAVPESGSGTVLIHLLHNTPPDSPAIDGILVMPPFVNIAKLNGKAYFVVSVIFVTGDGVSRSTVEFAIAADGTITITPHIDQYPE